MTVTLTSYKSLAGFVQESSTAVKKALEKYTDNLTYVIRSGPVTFA